MMCERYNRKCTVLENVYKINVFKLFVFAVLACSFMNVACAVDPKDLDVVILGDSNTWIGGDNCNSKRGWNYWFKQYFNPHSCRSFARSGATWTATPSSSVDTLENIGVLGSNNIIYNQVERLAGAIKKGTQPVPGMVIISAGTNDVWFHAERPDALSSEAASIDGINLDSIANLPPSHLRSIPMAVASAVTHIRRFAPETMLVVLTPMQCIHISDELLLKLSTLIELTCSKLDVTAVRMDYISPVSAKLEKIHPKLTSDGTHTSEEGARLNGILLSRILCERVRNL